MKAVASAIKFAAAVFLATVIALGTAGCRSAKNDIVFTDDASLPRLETNAVAPVKASSLPKADETKIELQVFSNLLTRHFWEDGEYTAIFLRADDAEVAALQKSFPDRKPPIKEGYRADITIFDPDDFRDEATYANPHRYPSGARTTVIVNGTVVIENATHTGATPGIVLRRGTGGSVG